MTRDEAIKELELIAKVTIWNDRREAVEMAIEALQAEPVKHGEWEDVNGDETAWRCDQCKEISCCNDNFCSNCGADMRGDKHEDD